MIHHSIYTWYIIVFKLVKIQVSYVKLLSLGENSNSKIYQCNLATHHIFFIIFQSFCVYTCKYIQPFNWKKLIGQIMYIIKNLLKQN